MLDITITRRNEVVIDDEVHYTGKNEDDATRVAVSIAQDLDETYNITWLALPPNFTVKS